LYSTESPAGVATRALPIFKAAPVLPRRDLWATTIAAHVTDAEWDAYVANHPAATGYHQSAWRDVFLKAFRHRSRYLAARRDGHISGILPIVVLDTWAYGKFGVSLPFVNYGGVVADDDETAGFLLNAARETGLKENWKYLEIRHVAQRFSELPVKTHKVGMYLPLPNFAPDLWNLIDRKVRNQVRKAEKCNCVCRNGGIELLDSFYPVFARTMRDLGTPVYTKRFFSSILETFPESTRVFVVTIDDKPVAASLIYKWRKVVEVPWAASLREYRTQCANMLLYWEMLQWSIQKGATTFDFGRSTRDGGTYQFKRQWGAEPQQLHWEYWLRPDCTMPDMNPKNPKYSQVVATWQRLPVWLTNLVGPSLVRMFP
jgi:FemAB-related protein (PEP-CTERM system-associated)